MQLETDRTVIRDFCKDDLYDLYEILSDAETMEYIESPFSIEKTRSFLSDFCIGQRCAVAAELKSTGKVIGYLLFKPYGTPDVYEIGWIFNRKFWRQGLAYEACAALIKYAFLSMGIRKVFAETVDAVRSLGLMKKLGMKPDSDIESAVMYVYSITKNGQ